MPFSKITKNTPKTNKKWTKKIKSKIFWNASSIMLLNFQTIVFEGVFGFFDVGKPYFQCIRAEDF